MDIILYNPLSKSGASNNVAFKLHQQLNKKQIPNKVISLIQINNLEEFVLEHQDADRFIIIGGDGTLNVLANNIKDLKIKADIYLYASGTGNDFARSLGIKGKLIDIKKYLYNLPTVSFNDERLVFLNGVGLGFDGLVVDKVNNSRHKNTKFNYFRHVIEGLREHKKSSVELTIDGQNYQYDNTWFVSVMNSEYFGGGMKVAPKQKRDNSDLSVVIVKKASKLVLLLIFPIIYLGLHKYLKRYVRIIKANDVTINFLTPQMMQVDGEGFRNINKITVKK